MTKTQTKKKTLSIWAPDYNPFIMGGNVNAPMMITIEVGEPVELGKGFFGHELNSPNGTIVVVEADSGAVIGSSLKMVRKDVKACKDVEMMRKQIRDSLKEKEQARETTPAEFWRKIEKRAASH